MNHKMTKINVTDSALARNTLRRYVDEGNNVTSAEDIFKALLASPITNVRATGLQ